MARMIIVDDDALECECIQKCINWDMLGIQIVGIASNGSQGYLLAAELKPDIILTDVKMPLMNGIEMIRKIRDMGLDIHVIFLSSYDEFEYAKQAIHLKASAYITKPINELELIDIMKKIVDETTSSQAASQSAEKKDKDYQRTLPLAQQAVLYRMLIGLPVGENDSHSFGLDWIMNASHIGMMVSLFDKNHTDEVIKRVDSINRIMTKLYVNSITVCLFEGVLITIIAATDIIDDAFISSPKSILIGALQECGCCPVHIDSVYNNKSGTSLPTLYLKAIQRNAVLLPGPSLKALEERRSKSSIVESVVSLIEQHYQDYLTTEVIAKHLHFTPNYLGLVFKTEKKISVNRYVLLVRLNHAKKLMEEKEPIADIAAKCGFESITYFYSTFKKETGMTPSEFRGQVQKA